MSTNKGRKPRPYWHVDAKWLTGILLLCLLNITLLVFILVQATAPEQGITLLTTILANTSSFGSGGLAAADDLEFIRQKIAGSPTGEWQPIPGLLIIIRAEDIQGKSPREVRMWFFRQMAEPLYYEGGRGLAGIMTDPAMQENLVTGGVGPLGSINSGTHRKLLGIFTASGLVSLVFLALLVIFSYRFGRLGSPGCVITLATIPGLLLFGGVRGWLDQVVNDPTLAPDENALVYYAHLAADLLPVAIQSSMKVYLVLACLGLGLMLMALIGTLLIRERKAGDPSA